MKAKNKDSFIADLNDAGQEAREEFEKLSNELNMDVQLGLIEPKDLADIMAVNPKARKAAKKVKTPKPNAKKVIVDDSESFYFANDKIYVREFLPAILSGIPSLAKSILSKQLIWSEIDTKNIGIDKQFDANLEDMAIVRVYFLTPFGNRLHVKMKEIYKLLLKIDLE